MMKKLIVFFCSFLLLPQLVFAAGYWDIPTLWEEFADYIVMKNPKNLNISGNNITTDYIFANLSKGSSPSTCNITGSCSPNVPYMDFENTGYIGAAQINLTTTNRNQTAIRITGSRLISKGVLPDTIPSLEVWYDANRTVDITLVNGNVSNWSDRNGGAFQMQEDNVSRQPFYNSSCINGNACVEFDGVLDGLTSEGKAIANNMGNPFTFTIVARNDEASPSTGENSILGAVKDNTGQGAGIYQPNEANKFCGRADQSGSETAICSEGVSGFHVVTYQGTNGDVRLYIDGVEVATSTDDIQAFDRVDRMAIPYNDLNTVNRKWEGAIAEAMFFTADLDKEDRELYEAYLCDKYAIKCELDLYFQQVPYIAVLDENNNTVFNVSETGFGYFKGGGYFGGGIDADSGNFRNAPLIMASKGTNSILEGGSAGNGDFLVWNTSNPGGDGDVLVYTSHDTGTGAEIDIFRWGCDFGRCSFTITGVGQFVNSSVYGIITNAGALGTAFATRGEVPGFYTLGSGATRFTDDFYVQFDISNLK